MTSHTPASTNPVDQLIAWLEPYFTEKAPFQLPQEAKDWIVNYGWAVSLVLGILILPGVVGLLGMYTAIGTVATGFGIHIGPAYWLSGAALAIQMVLLFAAIPGLKARSYRRGWMVVFYGELFSALSTILHLTVFSIISAAISFAIGAFILFQVKKYYK